MQQKRSLMQKRSSETVYDKEYVTTAVFKERRVLSTQSVRNSQNEEGKYKEYPRTDEKGHLYR